MSCYLSSKFLLNLLYQLWTVKIKNSHQICGSLSNKHLLYRPISSSTHCSLEVIGNRHSGCGVYTETPGNAKLIIAQYF